MPFQSEKQRRYLWANEPEIARDWADTYGSRIKKDDGGIMHQFENYARDDGDNVSVPKTFQARAGSEPVDLAYVTPQEQEVLQSLKPGTPHKGPMGIPNYDSFDISGGYTSGRDIDDKTGQARESRTATTGSEAQKQKNIAAIKASETKQRKDVKEWKAEAKAKRPTLLHKAQDFNKKIQKYGIQNMAKTDQAKIIAALNYAATKGGRYVGDTEEEWSDIYPSYGTGKFFDDGKRGYKEKTIKDFETGKRTYGIPNIGPEFYTPGEGKLSLLANAAGKMFSGPITSERLDYLTKQGGKLSSLDPNMTRDEYMKEFRPKTYAKENLNTGGRDRQEEWQRAGYPSYAAWQAAQGGGGGGATVGPPVEEESEFQKSLTTNVGTPNYYVGDNPLASNIAWGKQAGVDPRTMGLTSWAAEGGRIPAAYGGIMDTETGRRAYGLGSIFKKIGRAAKKVFKSPIGKAALIGLGGYWGLGKLGGIEGLRTMAGGTGWKGNLLKNFLMSKKDPTKFSPWKLGIGAASMLPFFMGGKEEDEDDKFDYMGAKNKYRDELMNIKRGVMAGSLNPNEFSYLPSNYTYTGAEGGRAGMYAGGQSTPSDYTMEDARMTTTQDKLGGITDVMKQADLFRKGSVGQMYSADGGRIGYQGGGAGNPPITMGQAPQVPPQMPDQPPQRPHPMPAPQPNRMAGMPGGMPGGMNPMMAGMNPMMNRPMMNRPMMGGRMMAQEGGLMDMGGMEKDYRNDGGFVPLGGEEKADDVPARLSKNEFVFTADAVRGAGDGDIDKGAEVMENIMKNLEQGGQISEETQGLSGAQEMFGVSERLSEVV